jgi:hypothetical protein
MRDPSDPRQTFKAPEHDCDDPKVGSKTDEKCTRFIYSILRQAVEDLESRDRDVAMDAKEWIEDADSCEVQSFNWFCETLDCDPETIRNKILYDTIQFG